MTIFGNKVKEAREKLEISQQKLGDLVGISRRTIVDYEMGKKYPKEASMRKLAKVLGVTEFYLANDTATDPNAGLDEEPYLQQAKDKFGKSGESELSKLLKQNEALFAGGTLSQDQKDLFYQAISQAYFMNRTHAKEKFTPKKYRKDSADNSDSPASGSTSEH